MHKKLTLEQVEHVISLVMNDAENFQWGNGYVEFDCSQFNSEPQTSGAPVELVNMLSENNYLRGMCDALSSKFDFSVKAFCGTDASEEETGEVK